VKPRVSAGRHSEVASGGVVGFRLGNFTRGLEFLRGSESRKWPVMLVLSLATRMQLGRPSEGRIAEDPYRGLRAGPAFLPSAYFSCLLFPRVLSATASYVDWCVPRRRRADARRTGDRIVAATGRVAGSALLYFSCLYFY
jgi:hypothetical protein